MRVSVQIDTSHVASYVLFENVSTLFLVKYMILQILSFENSLWKALINLVMPLIYRTRLSWKFKKTIISLDTFETIVFANFFSFLKLLVCYAPSPLIWICRSYGNQIWDTYTIYLVYFNRKKTHDEVNWLVCADYICMYNFMQWLIVQVICFSYPVVWC